MNIKHLNESFKNLYEDNVEDVRYAVDGDLRTALTDAAISLETSGNGNIKAYEDAFQRVLEEFYPDKSWWEVTTCNIFWSLFEGRNPKLTIDDIMNNLITTETTDIDTDNTEEDIVVEESLHEGNAVSNNLSSNIDKFLQDLAQVHGHFDYNDIMNFKPTEEDIKYIRNLMTKYTKEAQYGDEDAEKACDLIARDIANIIGHNKSIKESVNTKTIKVTRDTKGSLEEQLRECLNRLNEAQISPEDQYESDVIRGMLAKLQKRSNAKFTEEEKALMKKYDIHRDDFRGLTVGPNGTPISRRVDDDKGYGWGTGRYHNGDSSKINYADRARKTVERDKNQFNGHAGAHFFRNDDYNKHGGIGQPYTDLEGARRAQQNNNPRMDTMKYHLGQRKYYKDIIDGADAAYERDSALAKDNYEKTMAQITRRRDDAKNGYTKRSFDDHQAKIDRILNKDKTNSGE